MFIAINKKAYVVVDGAEFASRTTHAWNFSIPDNFVQHSHLFFEIRKNLWAVLPTQKYIEAGIFFKFWQDCVNPLKCPAKIFCWIFHVRVIAIIFTQTIWWVCQDQIY